MKKRFSDEQIMSILPEAEAGVSARELCPSTPFPTPSFTRGARSMAVWKCPRLSA